MRARTGKAGFMGEKHSMTWRLSRTLSMKNLVVRGLGWGERTTVTFVTMMMAAGLLVLMLVAVGRGRQWSSPPPRTEKCSLCCLEGGAAL